MEGEVAMETSFLIFHKIKNENDCQQYFPKEENIYDNCLERINQLPYYEKHHFRKNGVMALHIYMSCSDTTINISAWSKQNLVWVKQEFLDSIIVVEHAEEGEDCFEHNICLIPISNAGRVSFDWYCGTIAKLSHLQQTYSQRMYSYFNLKRDPAGKVRLANKTGIYRPSDYPQELGAPPEYNGDVDEYITQTQDYILKMQQYYQEQLGKERHVQIDNAEIENQYLKKENARLNKYVQPYLDFLEHYGGLKKARQMIHTAQHVQYAIRSYQEKGDQDSVRLAMKIIQDGYQYVKNVNARQANN